MSTNNEGILTLFNPYRREENPYYGQHSMPNIVKFMKNTLHTKEYIVFTFISF